MFKISFEVDFLCVSSGISQNSLLSWPQVIVAIGDKRHVVAEFWGPSEATIVFCWYQRACTGSEGSLQLTHVSSFTCWFIWFLWAAGTTVLPSFPESPTSVSWILVQLHEKGRHIVLEETSLLGAVRAWFKFNPFLEVFLSCRLPILFHVCILVSLWTACHALKQ